MGGCWAKRIVESTAERASEEQRVMIEKEYQRSGIRDQEDWPLSSSGPERRQLGQPIPRCAWDDKFTTLRNAGPELKTPPPQRKTTKMAA